MKSFIFCSLYKEPPCGRFEIPRIPFFSIANCRKPFAAAALFYSALFYVAAP
jgi:hypothetical protein